MQEQLYQAAQSERRRVEDSLAQMQERLRGLEDSVHVSAGEIAKVLELYK